MYCKFSQQAKSRIQISINTCFEKCTCIYAMGIQELKYHVKCLFDEKTNNVLELRRKFMH